MQRTHGIIDVIFVDHKADVDLRSPLGNHVHVGFRQRTKDFRGDAACTADIFTHQAHDRFSAFIFHVGQFLEIGSNRGNRFGGIYRK